jgi:adenosylcobinamide-GDP ribazoletransferase
MKSFISAIGLLTIIPVPYKWAKNISNASVYFSLAGLFIGLLYFIFADFMLKTGISADWAAFIITGFQVTLTRAFHLDGLADMADGFWGGKDREHRLKIMKDSSIGVYGAISLILLLLGKWIAIENLFGKKMMIILVISSVVSRFSMTLLSGLFSYSRNDGTGHAVVSKTGLREISISIIYTIIILYFLAGWGTFLVFFSAASLSLLIGLISYVKINGITGDILGSSCELVDLFILSIAPLYILKFPVLFHSPSGIL